METSCVSKDLVHPDVLTFYRKEQSLMTRTPFDKWISDKTTKEKLKEKAYMLNLRRLVMRNEKESNRDGLILFVDISEKNWYEKLLKVLEAKTIRTINGVALNYLNEKEISMEPELIIESDKITKETPFIYREDAKRVILNYLKVFTEKMLENIEKEARKLNIEKSFEEKDFSEQQRCENFADQIVYNSINHLINEFRREDKKKLENENYLFDYINYSKILEGLKLKDEKQLKVFLKRAFDKTIKRELSFLIMDVFRWYITLVHKKRMQENLKLLEEMAENYSEKQAQPQIAKIKCLEELHNKLVEEINKNTFYIKTNDPTIASEILLGNIKEKEKFVLTKENMYDLEPRIVYNMFSKSPNHKHIIEAIKKVDKKATKTRFVVMRLYAPFDHERDIYVLHPEQKDPFAKRFVNTPALDPFETPNSGKLYLVSSLNGKKNIPAKQNEKVIYNMVLDLKKMVPKIKYTNRDGSKVSCTGNKVIKYRPEDMNNVYLLFTFGDENGNVKENP